MSPQPQVPENDITGKMSQYMHEHLLIEILLDMRNKNIYPEKELYEETVKLVEERTEKILLLQDLTNKDYSDRNRDACRDLDNLSTKVANLLTIMEEGKIQELLTKSNTFQDLLQLGNISREEINNLYYWSKAQFNYGFYAKSILGMTVYSEILKKIVLLELEREGGVPDEPRYSILNLKWGLLAAHILEKNWEHASLIALQIEEYLEFCSTNAPSTSSLNSLLGIMQGNTTAALTVAGGPNGLQFSMSPFGVQGNLQVMLSKKEILQQRCWLFHWTLFILFKGQSGLNQQINQQATTAAAEEPSSTVEGNTNGETNSAEAVASNPGTICSLVNPKMWDRLLDTFVSEAYLALISLQAPHLLRYVAALYIREKRLKSLTKDLIHVLSQDKENYSDSLTEFLLALHQDLDFDTAKTKLVESQTLINNDYFLSGVYDSTNNSQVTIRDPVSGITTVHVAKPTIPSSSNLETIMNNARLSIFQIYCRTHQSVDINTIADKMGLPSEICEEYIVSLIQAGKLSGACIDYKEKSDSNSSDASVFFPKNKTDVSTQVLEKTKNMSFRLFLLQANATTTQQMKKDQTKLGNLSAELAKHLN